MSRIADRIREYVNDLDVSDHFGAWGILRRDQRRLIRELCDTCDMFEKTADDLARKQSEVIKCENCNNHLEDQIEEMAKELCGMNIECKDCGVDKLCQKLCLARNSADILYNAGYRKQEWISVDERLPDGYGSFLVAFKSKLHWKTEWVYCVGVAIYNVSEIPSVNGWDFEIGDGYEYIITHWMPLPTPPKEDKND